MGPQASAIDDPERARVLALLKQHGFNATSFQILEAGFRYWFASEEDACVAYVDTGAAWVVAGAPICAVNRLRDVTARFVARSEAAQRRVCFFATEERFHAHAPLGTLLVGEQPVWDPSRWEATLAESKSLRAQLRRARAKGVQIRIVSPDEVRDEGSPTRAAIEALILRWLRARSMAAMGFLVDVQPFAFAEERRYFLAERDGRAVGFLAAVPVYARAGWLFEDFLRDPKAPNGTAELLIDAGMRLVASEGSRYATLGLAPLSGVRGWLRLARQWSAALYDFDGVRSFKAKLKPHVWEPIYLAHTRSSRAANVALYDVLAAFARGSFARFGLETLLRGPAIVVRVLAAMLVPWTALLVLADTHRWFPWAWVKYGWVAFDALLVAGLFALAARWRAWLARTLAVLVSFDSVVTLVELLAFNVPIARGALDGVVIAIAWLAPTFAAIVLWGATAKRSSA